MSTLNAPKHTNALAGETSPYLLQHAHNPVNWQPWGSTAFAQARREDKPIFLSVGYSACHWCHVMERESFENEAVAELLNAHFVPIKVDREERPDVDEVYMAAVEIVTQSGGWPMSVFLTPEGKPFFGGTYFPPENRYGRSGFKTLLRQIAMAWKEQRADLLLASEQLSAAVREQLALPRLAASQPLDARLLAGFVERLHEQFDPLHGGFAIRPKFPPGNALPLLLYLQAHLTPPDPRIRDMLTRTLDQMARGGIHDQAGGGFHRYSTDEKWLVPHFEKTLYDNALLAEAYAAAAVACSNPEYALAARGTYDWALREMTAPEDAFYSALDADSAGQEGKFYLWSKPELEALLGPDAAVFCAIFNVREEGNFPDEATSEYCGTNILHLTEPLAALAPRLQLTEPALRAKVAAWKETLLAARAKRIRPATDDKILTYWNALMIASLARGAALLQEPRYGRAAERAAEFLLRNLRTADGRWLAVCCKGQCKLPAYLDDHASLAVAFLELYSLTRAERWKDEAAAVMKVLEQHFAAADGGYFFTADDHEQLLARTKNPLDKATPAGNGLAAQALVRLCALTGDNDYRQRADKIFTAFHGLMEHAPAATASLLLAFAQHVLPPAPAP